MKQPSKDIYEPDERLYMKNSGRIVPTAGIYRSLPHNMYYEFTDKWAFTVSAVHMTVFMRFKHWHTRGKTRWRKTQSITSQQAQNTFKTHEAEWIKTQHWFLGELAGNTLTVGLFPSQRLLHSLWFAGFQERFLVHLSLTLADACVCRALAGESNVSIG